MTATVQPESKSPSRRALLAGALGGLGAWAAGAIGRASSVQAANGDPVLVGQGHAATSTTFITKSGVGTSIAGTTTGSGFTIGVAGRTTSLSSGYGVEGLSDGQGGRGVHGQATYPTGLSYGVLGQSAGTTGFGSVGLSTGNATGVLGYSGSWPIPAAKAKTGVFGYGAQDTSSKGVWGQSTSGTGLFGSATSGYAIRGSGRVKLGKVSGVATINAGNISVTVTPGVNVTSDSFVLLTPKANIGTRALWFTTNPTGNRFMIHMSSSRSSSTKVAWLLLG